MTVQAKGPGSAPAQWDSEGAPQPTVCALGPSGRLQLLIDLRCAELANALGLTWRLVSLQRALVIALAGLCAALPALGYGFARFFSVLSTDVAAPALLIPLLTFLPFMSGLGTFFAESMGRYRNAVSGHPNRAYFRALDIPAVLVHAVYVVPRIAGAAGFWVLAGGGAIAGLLSVSSHQTWLPVAVAGILLQPMAWMATAYLVSLRLAGNSAASGVTFGAGAGAAAAIGVAGGLLFSRVLLPRLPRGGSMPAASSDVPAEELGAALAATMALLTLVVAVLSWPQRRRLRSLSFTVDPQLPAARVPRLGRSQGWYWFRLMRGQRRHSWRKRVEDRIGWVLMGAACALAAARLTGAAQLAGVEGVPAGAAANVLVAAGVSGALLGLACAETTLGDLGPRVFGGALRAAVELGAPVRTAVVVHGGALLAPAVLLGFMASTLASLMLGRVEPLPLAAAAGAGAGSIIAERLFPPPRTVDGGAGESLATAMAALILGGVPVGWMLLAPALAVFLTPLSAAALLGGALWCIRRSLTVL